MKQNRDRVLRWMAVSEGGYVNHPKDPGGATNMGVTQNTYNAFRKASGLDIKSVRSITRVEADEIFAKQYMDTVRFDELPSGVDYAMADYSVNSGPSRAIKDLQRVLEVEPDGVIGKMTLSALAVRDEEEVIVELCKRRMAFLRSLKTWKTFGKGWQARVEGKSSGIQTDDVGVVDRAVMLSRASSIANMAPPIEIPEPVISAAKVGKGLATDVGANSILTSMLKEPASIVPVISAIAPLLQGQGPLQIAMSIAIVAVTGFTIYRLILRETKAT